MAQQSKPTVSKRSRKSPPASMRGMGRRFREAREKRGLGVVELEEMAGISGGRVSRLEKEQQIKNISLAIVVRLAEVLRFRLAWLVLGEEPKERGETQIILQGDIPESVVSKVIADLQARREKRSEKDGPTNESPVTDDDDDGIRLPS